MSSMSKDWLLGQFCLSQVLWGTTLRPDLCQADAEETGFRGKRPRKGKTNE